MTNIIGRSCFNIHLRIRISTVMKRIKLGTNFAVFILFFGVGILEAFQTSNWPKALFWFAIGLVFLAADNLKRA
ncbi:MAG TPA: hypothetical protein VGQ04_13710 [Chitinophagaceae bacterium]|nr:hypothetical protein [Chitinophagaceae bacterium]